MEENEINITSKIEAYNYLRDVRFGVQPISEVHIETAKTFFEEGELINTIFNAPHLIEDCFPGLAKKCNCACDD